MITAIVKPLTRHQKKREREVTNYQNHKWEKWYFHNSTDIKRIIRKNYCAGWIVFPKNSCLPETGQCDLSENSVYICDQVKVRSD